MSFNGSGVFSINTTGQPVVTNTTITSTAFNALTADLAVGLTTCLTKDGQSTPTANLPMGGYKLTGLAVGSSSGDSLAYGNTVTSTIAQKLMFSAVNSTAQTVTTGVSTMVTVAETLDPNGNFASNRHTPTVAGTYRYRGTLVVTATSVTLVDLYIYKNGASARWMAGAVPGSTNALPISGCVDIAMNGTTDYVELFGNASGTGTVQFAGAAPSLCSFSGEYIGV